jgi:hypothetical protein
LDWIGLDWIGLDWIGLDWIGLDWIGLDWMAGSCVFLFENMIITFYKVMSNCIIVQTVTCFALVIQ